MLTILHAKQAEYTILCVDDLVAFIKNASAYGLRLGGNHQK